jgi:hypothetical protein
MLLIQKVIKDLYEAKSSISHAVLSTQNVEDFASYKFLVGKLNGLDVAINICQLILEELGNDTNERNRR